jgi:hypothetical protein
MESRGCVTSVRVVVRLSPPLVAELLARLLDHPGIDVVIDASDGKVELRGDLLVTSEPLRALPPATVVTLPESIAPGIATVFDHGGSEEVVIDDLDAIACVVRRLCNVTR